MPEGSFFSADRDTRAVLNRAEPDSQRILLVFELSDRLAALPLTEVERITSMAELACPPGLPSILEGILNLADVAIPVLRLDRLFGLPPQRLGLYSMLIILRASGEGRLAILVDSVKEILPVLENTFHPIQPQDSFNGCAEATIDFKGTTAYVLSARRLLLAKEQKALSQFQTTAQKRLQNWEISQA